MLFVDDSDPMGAPGRPRVSGERPPRDNGRKRSHWMISSARTRTDWGIVTPSALAVLSRVEDWRGTRRPVSSPRRIKPGVPISGTGLSWALRVMGYETYRLGALSGRATYRTR